MNSLLEGHDFFFLRFCVLFDYPMLEENWDSLRPRTFSLSMVGYLNNIGLLQVIYHFNTSRLARKGGLVLGHKFPEKEVFMYSLQF